MRESKYVKNIGPVTETVKEQTGNLVKKLGVIGGELKELKKELPPIKSLFGRKWF